MSQSSQFSLLKQRRFAPFFWTQFLGAFNDNVFKTALLVILTYDAVSWTSLDPAILNSLIPGLFILPYVLFSATAGQIAEKVEKARLARFVKMLEIAIMAVAGLGWMTHTLWLLIASVVGMGVHSTLFGPVKYAYMPQHLKSEELVGGNGVVEMGTFVGILLGQILGAALVLKPHGLQLVAGATMFFAVLGLVASYRIPLSPAPAPDLKINPNPFAESVRNIGHARKNRTVFLSMLGNSWFWFYGAMILSQFPLYAKQFLHGDYSVFVMLLTVFSVGVGVGSLLCEKLSGHKVEIGLVPFGSIGLSLFGIDLYFASLGYVRPPVEVAMMGMLAQAGVTRVLFDIAMIGVFGGLFIVPLFALIQTRCEPAHLSRTIGGMNILNALFMICAAGVAIVMIKMGFTIPDMFLATAILNAIVALYIFSLVPEFLMRFLAWMLIHTIHRVKTVDVDRIPDDGPAILVCNHVSYVDAIVIGAASPRPIRFVMDHKIFKMPFMGWLFRTARAIPIAPAKEDQFLMEKAYIDIAQALHEGDLVCIFPEGRLTSTGEMGEFRGGIAKIVERSKVPVIPMALRGLWGSLLTRDPGNLFERTFARGPRSRLALAVGTPVAPEDATPDYLHKQVLALRGDWK
ncbi:MFS transporter [Massilia antarctica]|uniref:MFS transporter n=1 Tax=Massilia antarctica TaxID=2765360 RepID=UPI0006BB9469|nr:MFS transporter [Massilia sp. H27-R4]MCY0911665.1 MFS transporter [Massilia sp. H27-R4]CUI04710.1 Lysophospholipid transporter LplT / 2-acylglycerophosphoethanolamine acyltransferase / Acyl-[acyl-carrier-protein] synthetase [Janthinobacterium sp. CG23_2]CUU28496.1 Lysophospholipid transporter LplT / 2-acylglycerophosphoethanolamine acyltransferase / Acyl-[acyl-carrier-protein] synthetase [Janthinobacterium sp. CG23_2]